MFQIVENVYARLVEMREECVGALYGIMWQNSLVVTCLSVERPKQVESCLEMQLHLPTGIDYCGAFRCRNTGNEGESVEPIMKEVQITDNPLLLEKEQDGEVSARVLRDGRLTDTCLKILPEKEFLDWFVLLRLRGSVCLPRSSEERQRTLSEDCVFHFVGTEHYLFDDDDSTSKTTLGDLADKAPVYMDPRLKKGLVQVQVLRPMSSKAEKRLSSFSVGPNEKRHYTRINSTVDAICIVERSRPLEALYGLLNDTFCRHLQLVENTIASCDEDKVSDLELYHFYVAPQFVTLLLGRNEDDVQSKHVREHLHKRLALPRDRPFFRRGNRLVLSARPTAGLILFNVHGNLSSGLSEGHCATVRGLYSYHHYMQDEINDDGWGCAYRSLQTLFSWYRYQGYTDADIPSHKQIQTCLVDIGDKQKKFIGSREWIGSAEVGYCLNTWLGITTYTLTYPSGTALRSSGPDLYKHFQLHGTPVMIGGNNLAHTLLGVHYNEETEEIKFLVLDPHYTGRDDLRTVQTKGWVGWKPLSFWNKNTFYNMCLPSRPRTL